MQARPASVIYGDGPVSPNSPSSPTKEFKPSLPPKDFKPGKKDPKVKLSKLSSNLLSNIRPPMKKQGSDGDKVAEKPKSVYEPDVSDFILVSRPYYGNPPPQRPPPPLPGREHLRPSK